MKKNTGILIVLIFIGVNLIVMGRELKIMTYNIYGGRLAGGEVFAESIKKYNPDFISLQEVDKNTRRSKGVDITEKIAQELGYSYYFFQKSRDFDGGEYGISFISKYPVEKIYTYELPSIGIEKRQVLAAQLLTEDKEKNKSITIINTHLDYKEEIKEEEISALLSIIDSFEGDIKFLSGDLNMLPSSKYYEKVSEKWEDTFFIENEEKRVNENGEDIRIDYIFGNKSDDWEVEKSYFIKDDSRDWTKLSDHFPYIAELNIDDKFSKNTKIIKIR